jgi:hypothetical protein
VFEGFATGGMSFFTTERKRVVYGAAISVLIEEIGESVSVFYEPLNEGQEWTVGLARLPMVHEHWGELLDGLRWLADNKPRFDEWEAQINEARDKP